MIRLLTKKTMPMSINIEVPSFKTLSDKNEELSQDHFKNGKFVLYFYPKDNTPGCTLESCNFRDNNDLLIEKGFEIFGISKDSIESHEKFKKNQKLPFTLLSDQNGNMCEAFGVWKQKSFLGKKYMGIERSTFIIVDGKIIKEWRDLKAKGHVDDVLHVIHDMGL